MAQFTESTYQELLQLVEVAPDHENTWFECAGDVARFVFLEI
jgi:hypothetical protein